MEENLQQSSAGTTDRWMDGWMALAFLQRRETLNLFFSTPFCLSVIDTSGWAALYLLFLVRVFFLVARCFPSFRLTISPNPIIIKSHVSARFVAAYFYFYFPARIALLQLPLLPRLLPWKIALNLKISHVTRRESISPACFSLLFVRVTHVQWIFMYFFFTSTSPLANFPLSFPYTKSSCTLHVIRLTVSSFPRFSFFCFMVLPGFSRSSCGKCRFGLIGWLFV